MKYNPYCKNLITKVFDIETTGLYPVHDRVISASFCNTDGSDLKQFFCDAPQNEDILLEQIIAEIEKYDVIITYNGAMFDLPFIVQRAKQNHVAEHLSLFWSVDLYRWLKSYWPAAKTMESLRQKAVEEALGLSDNRTDEIGGGECISLYANYVNWNDEHAKELILLHNGDDVRQLGRIADSLSFLPYHQICFEKGFLIRNAGKRIRIETIKLQKTKMTVKAKTLPGMIPTDIYNDSYHLEYDTLSGNISLDFYTQSKGEYQFINIEKIFEDLTEFLPFAGYQSGYLMLSGPNGISYRECNFVASKLMKLYF